LAKLIAIVGPTATGKSRFSIELAESIGGEIINADSRQIYKHMDIGTGTPSSAQRARVKHHLYNLIDPDESFSLGVYLNHGRQTISDVMARNKLPILVGGTAQYVWALLEGWQVPSVAPNPDFRDKLEKLAEKETSTILYDRLTNIDPAAAKKIHPNNVRRLIRALEVIDQTGQLFSDLSSRRSPNWEVNINGITMEQNKLQDAIYERILDQFNEGWVEEVKDLRQRGYKEGLPSLSALGYKEIGRYIDGHTTMEETISEIAKLTHRFSRKQYGWFKLSDPRIHWNDITKKNTNELINEITTDLSLG
tara:strand:+ start:39166 stop:40086 length:921 start_codon:yes stop_codon:yes gene_type:complete